MALTVEARVKRALFKPSKWPNLTKTHFLDRYSPSTKGFQGKKNFGNPKPKNQGFQIQSDWLIAPCYLHQFENDTESTL